MTRTWLVQLAHLRVKSDKKNIEGDNWTFQANSQVLLFAWASAFTWASAWASDNWRHFSTWPLVLLRAQANCSVALAHKQASKHSTTRLSTLTPARQAKSLYEHELTTTRFYREQFVYNANCTMMHDEWSWCHVVVVAYSVCVFFSSPWKVCNKLSAPKYYSSNNNNNNNDSTTSTLMILPVRPVFRPE